MLSIALTCAAVEHKQQTALTQALLLSDSCCMSHILKYACTHVLCCLTHAGEAADSPDKRHGSFTAPTTCLRPDVLIATCSVVCFMQVKQQTALI